MFAFLGADPATLADTTQEDQWETVESLINPFLGYGMSVDAIVPMVCRGVYGVDGLCNFLSYFVENHRLVGALFEGKVEV